MAKSGKLLGLLNEMAGQMGLPDEQRDGSRIDSLGRALQVAMQTIANASQAVSGKATELLPVPDDRADLPIQECPVDLGSRLADKNYCWYKGYYHTDQTLPRMYFRDDVQRADDVHAIEPLDFTYLFQDSADNPAYRTMGAGISIRDDELDRPEAPSYKRARVEPSELLISSEPRLVAALSEI